MYTNNMPDASGCVGQVNIFCTYSFTSTLLSSMSLMRPIMLSIAEHHHHHYKITIGSPGSLAPTCGFSLLPPSSSIPCGSPSLEGQIVKIFHTLDWQIVRKPIWWKSSGFTKLLLFSGGSSSPFCPYQGATTFYNLIFNWKPFAKNSTEPNYISDLIPP